MSLANKKVVIIGGSSGIGLATAKATLTAQAKVLIAGRSLEKLQQAQQEIGDEVEIRSLDLLQENAIKQFCTDVGVIDHLVIPGSSVKTGLLRELDTADAQKSMASKFWGSYLLTKYAQIADCGSIVLFSGILSRRPSPGYTVLAAINAAVEAFGRALALELAPVRVNVVSPGLVDTPVYAGMPQQQREAFLQSTADKLPVKRIGQPEDIAATVLYLLENGYTTGTVIDVDGGSLLV
ncbi:SDR family oxidoreductase [Gloeocapsopsis crepidinum LEGE 06123]|uniref:SDR family oxidoreductase n=1 Tax=Gloeocapsopsis crepidinum LEGE 06123 TaxID=588587 RepID=A0ABR9UMX7_9CHRO|nr:SDR family oxidoreductase [Gloeocapsopsis crepidinum]MBE9189622.1 SDR family oxidoreductase [Gloeocapsopsis crepidinum LEGE 06123]